METSAQPEPWVQSHCCWATAPLLLLQLAGKAQKRKMRMWEKNNNSIEHG